MYLGVEEVTPADLSSPALDMSDFQPAGNRMDAQVICIGKKCSEQLAALKIFMVRAVEGRCIRDRLHQWSLCRSEQEPSDVS